uniref:NADH dehydrogenase subunit 6 n=1 Tax=Meschia woodwardi TaxID=2813447 RepID=A0A8T9ZWQ8_9HEMI|nr:NADH dehydrogenase subunit 6 [Meschia woodwardi]
MNLMMSFMTSLSIIFLFVSHPLAMGLIIILQTTTISIITGLMLKSFWFSYIIMIIMLSGMLVLFIYMASIASNEKMMFSFKLLFTFMIMMMLLMSEIYSTEEYKLMNMNNYLSMTLNVLFNNVMITIIMILYLFFTMIVVSKIVNIHEGPLRMKK